MKTYYSLQSTNATTSGINIISFSIGQKPSDQTTGRKGDIKDRWADGSIEILDSAKSVIEGLKDEATAQAAKKLLTKIETAMNELIASGVDPKYIPKLRCIRTEDQALLCEWVSDKFRVGFVIEPDQRDSGWFLVTDKDLGEINASGLLSMAEIDSVLLKLIHFTALNT